GILTTWDDTARTRVLIEFETSWTWDELESAIEAVDQMIGSVTHQVDVMIDVEGSTLPKDFLSAAKNLLANPEGRPNEGSRVVIGAGKVIRTAYQTLQKTFGEKLVGREIVFAEDIPQARSLLYSMRMK
ncbi:MAG: hypothetical protein KC496_14150, partial [Anaerolineae bacterium]|nr:hypothetical protein [Anaerolineae bacterium]